MSFQHALDASPALASVYRAGLGALGGNRSRVHANNPRALLGSMNVEDAQREIDPQGPTWDYGIGVARDGEEVVVWVEVHSADALHIQMMISKLDALLQFLTAYAPEFRRLEARYVWLAT